MLEGRRQGESPGGRKEREEEVTEVPKELATLNDKPT